MNKRGKVRSKKKKVATTKVVHKVVADKSGAKELATALTIAAKYPYKATALLMGFIPLSPYDPIRLVGLTDNMDGVWVVMAVTHTFKKEFPYSMRVSLESNEKLLNTPVSSPVKDIANANFIVDSEVISEMFSENNMFLEVTNDNTGDFFVESIEFDVVTPEQYEILDSNNPVFQFIEALDAETYEDSLDPFEGVVYNRDPFEITTPDFTGADLEDNWVQESYN
jgi:hypothetical protein